MPALLLPAALTALLALLIPLAIHFARRSESVLTEFAALQWLRPKPRPRSRLRFDEVPLLLLRLLLLALLAVWLARPVLPGSADRTPVVAALPGVDAGIPAKNTRNIWLAPGFPPWNQPQNSRLAPPASPESLSSLIRQLDSELPANVPLTLIVPEILSGMDAQRLILSRPVTWRIVPGTMASPAATPISLPFLDIRPPDGPDRGLRILRAAAASWTAPGKPAAFSLAAPGAPLPHPPKILVWLAPGALAPAVRNWITVGGTALTSAETPAEPGPAVTIWRDSTAASLVTAQSIGNGRLLRFTRPLTAAATPDVLSADFPRQLAEILQGPPPAPGRTMAENAAPATGMAAWPQPARDLQPWLALLIAVLFLAERWLATSRRRAETP